MNIDAIAAINDSFIPPTVLPGINVAQGATNFSTSGPGNAATAAAGGDFGHWFNQQLSQVNGQMLQVDHEMQTLAVGGTQSLHQFMIHMEQTKLSFQLMAQVRNRLLEAYQEVMRMQV